MYASYVIVNPLESPWKIVCREKGKTEAFLQLRIRVFHNLSRERDNSQKKRNTVWIRLYAVILIYYRDIPSFSD